MIGNSIPSDNPATVSSSCKRTGASSPAIARVAFSARWVATGRPMTARSRANRSPGRPSARSGAMNGRPSLAAHPVSSVARIGVGAGAAVLRARTAPRAGRGGNAHTASAHKPKPSPVPRISAVITGYTCLSATSAGWSSESAAKDKNRSGSATLATRTSQAKPSPNRTPMPSRTICPVAES